MNSYDIAIVGAGPAGMSAALTAANAGASVVVLDEKSRAGGQIYRNVSASPLAEPEQLGADYLRGRELVEAFERCRVEKIHGATVWHVGDNGEVLFSRDQQTHSLTARELILSGGAMERPFPIPGWHLPGVMSAGSAQVMLKSDGLVHDDAVFVGSGPLLYLIVAQYLRLGVRVAALVDTTPKRGYLDALGRLSGAMAGLPMIAKGLGLLNEIRKAGVPVYRNAINLKIAGNARAAGIGFEVGSQSHFLPSNHLFLHQGVIPNLNMTRSLGLDHHWCHQQLCWKPTLDGWGQSSVTSISVAGDGSGIVGAEGAEHMGTLVALNQLSRLGLITESMRDQQAVSHQRILQRLNRFRGFIDRLYRPLDANRIPEHDETVVCRCEERTVGQLKQEFERGARGPNELKMMSRCGMGPCQGRQCGHTVSELLAKWRGERVEDVGYYRLRSPMRLLTLTELSRFNLKEPTPQQGSSVKIQEALR
ncbi:MAG: NAD(P)/FAD-dependent oxidoreductase [Halopseudomonas sp.]